MVLHSNQLEGLRELAVRFIRDNPLPPLAPEVLLVQSNGMKHWLELALAKDLGICAATEVVLPSAKLWQIYRAVLGPDCVPAHMPLDKSPLVWRILRRLPDLLKQPGFEPLAHYVGQHSRDERRAYQLAMQLADVLDGYQNYRADWLDDWAQHRDQLRSPQGSANPLPAAHLWQPALWRDLLQDLAHDPDVQTAAQHSFRSRAEVHDAFMHAMQQRPEGQRLAGVPQRLMVFGVTSLPMQTVEALVALGRVCQVLMLVQNPCQHHWGHVVESRIPLSQLTRQRQAHKPNLPIPRADGSLSEADQYTLHTATHPLLAAWGKQGRDYLHLLDNFDDVSHDPHLLGQRVDVFIDPLATAQQEGRAGTQLEHLQSALLHLDPPPHTPSEVPEGDTSITLVQAHSPQREVEVLHDRVLAWLDADSHLSPSDIMVMVPDMATFAPHIHAVWGRFAANDPRHLPYSVADTTPRTEPLVQALDMLLQLPQLRITRVEWQSLFEVAAVRQRFGLEANDVAQLDTWLCDAGVRWGLDAHHREPWGIAPNARDANQNSWLFGLERLLLGYASGTQATAATWQDTLSQPGVGGLDAHVISSLLQWLRHTQIALRKLQQPHTPQVWGEVLQQVLDLFFKTSDDADERLLERIKAPLETWLAECQLARLDSPLPLIVVREHWMSQLQQSALQRRFFGGGVQFATLMPMRAIPFKAVCLLGMNDGDYPRSQTPRDFDLMSDVAHAGSTHRHWRPGDRSRREDDRYLFLEALLSAREKLYISWQGRRTTDHELKPPSVLVAQLMDYLNTVWTRNGKDACEAPLQPLQAFSPRYFTQGSGFQTYASEWARARAPSTVAPVAVRSDPTAPQALTLTQLQRLLHQPVEVFLVDRLQLRLDRPAEAAEEVEPFALHGLNKYKISQRIAHTDATEQALVQLHLSGQLALASFGEMQQNQLLKERQNLRDQLDLLRPAWPHLLSAQSAQWQLNGFELSAEWANGQSLWYTHAVNDAWLQVLLRPGAVTEGKKETQQARLDTLSHLWLSHLAACASGTPTTSVQIGLDAAVELKPIASDEAQQQLLALCHLYAEAWTQPLPVAAKTACAYAMAVKAGHKDPLNKAKTAFEGAYQKSGELDNSPSLQRVFNSFSDVAPGMRDWSERLYGPMRDAATVIHLSTLTQEGDA